MTSAATLTLLTRAGCELCARADRELTALVSELQAGTAAVHYQRIDVDGAGQQELRAEYGDLVPVVLLDDEPHSYGEVDLARLRADLVATGPSAAQ